MNGIKYLLPKRKAMRLLAWLALLTSPLALQIGYSCSPAPTSAEYTFLSYEEFRQAVTAEPPRSINELGNIITYGDYLYAVEVGVGVHVWSLENSSSPQALSFIPIVNAAQIMVVNDVLFATSYVDIVAIDISDPVNASELTRIEFYRGEPLDSDFLAIGEAHPSNGIVLQVDYEYAKNACGGSSGPGCSCSKRGGASASPGSVGANNTGSNGSMSASIVVEDHLYLIANSRNQLSIIPINVQDPFNPILADPVDVDWSAQTLFAYEGALYVGGSSGVFIYDLSLPSAPKFAGKFEHVWQCDPVVVQGDFAYATLRSGVGCGGLSNELNVLDVADITAPQLLAQVPLNSPYGLAVENNLLFIADGYDGLKVFDIAAPQAPELINMLQVGFVSDVLVNSPQGVAVGPDQIVIFDYSNPINLQVISTID